MPESHQLINQDSGDTEYYTDPRIVNAAREVMGGIDLDPASSEIANRIIRASTFFDELDDGLQQAWFGKVFMNHPFSRAGNPLWVNKLISQYENGLIEQSCNICFAATSEVWFRPLHKYPQCYLVPRTNYYLPDGRKKTGVTKGSVVTYLGPNVDKFAGVFSEFGEVKIPYHLFKGE